MADFIKVAETAAGGNLGALIKKLACLTLEQVSQLGDVSDNIEFLKEELEILQAVLFDLSNEERPTESEKLWKNKIRELSYDMEDVIDKFMLASSNNAHAQTSAQDPSFIGTIKETIRSCTERIKRLPSDYETATKIQRLKERVAAVDDRRKRLKTERNDDDSSYDDSIPIRDLARYAAPNSLVGTEAPCKDIIRMLTDESSSSASAPMVVGTDTDESSSSASAPTVVAIVGFGGLGKTTLAKQAYKEIHGDFDLKAFVSISREPDIHKVLENILVDFGLGDKRRDDLRKLNKHQLIEELHKVITNKRYLVVVDDIWSEVAWRFLEAALFYNNTCGSKIIVTTRDNDVALRCCSYIDKQVYRMKPLNDDDSKQLFSKKAFGGKECPRNLEEVWGKALKKCAGSPLAILILSSLLVNKVTPNQWEHVLKTISSEDSKYGVVRRIISFSYFDLPQHLRTCLLYFALFPEDTEIKRKHLLNKWIAEGFISSKDGSSKTHIAEDYFNQLINRNLIQPVNIQYDGKARACRVHDTILEFIISEALEDNFVSVNNPQLGSRKVRRLTIQNFEDDTQLAEEHVSSIRSLIMFCPCSVSLLRCTNLRVLDTRGFPSYYDKRVFNFNVATLPHLKYLDLRESYFSEAFYTDRVLKGIGNLQYLETLDLRVLTRVKELPSDIYKLQLLVRLFIPTGVGLPDGIGQMKALEELKCVSIFSYSSLEFLQELGQLTKLGSIGVHIDHSGESQISPQQELILTSSLEKLSKGNLHSLKLDLFESASGSNCLPVSDEVSWHGALQSLSTFRMRYGYFTKVPGWMVSLTRLEKLVLRVEGMEQNDLDILGELPGLLHLWLIPDSPKERLNFRENKGFQCLRYLIVGDDDFETEGAMLTFQYESLRSLQLLGLKISIEVPGGYVSGIEHLHSLTTVHVIIGCPHWYRRQREEIATAITNAVNRLPNNPTLTIQYEDL